MADNRKKIQLYRTETSGSTTTDILNGEIAINFNSNTPFLMFKDNSSTIQKIGPLSNITGSSIYHTMTQKSISDALNTRKSEIEVLSSALTTEINNRESGDTTINERIDALENSINGKITSEISNLDATVSNNKTNVGITIVETDGKLTSVELTQTDIALASAVGLNTDGTFKVPTTAQTSGYTTAATSVMDAIIILDNQVEENETVTAYALTDLNNRMLEAEAFYTYMSGHTTTTTLTSIPTTKRLCIATISTSETLNISGSIVDGREVHIIVKNDSSSDITITIPSTIGGKTAINMIGEDLIIPAYLYGEINLTTDGTNIYYRGAA